MFKNMFDKNKPVRMCLGKDMLIRTGENMFR